MLIFILKLFFIISEKMSEKVSEFSLLHFSYVFSHLWHHTWFSFIHSVIFSCSFIIIDYHLFLHHWVSFMLSLNRYAAGALYISNIYVLTVDYHSFLHHWVSFVPKGLMETSRTSGAPKERNDVRWSFNYTLWRILLGEHYWTIRNGFKSCYE